MLYHIDGLVSALEPGLAVLDCGGVGFALNVASTTLSRLKTGERAKLYTYVHVREDCLELYGFYTAAERRSFQLLLGVSGVGPKAALSILSVGTPESLAMAIVSGDEKALTAAPGIGRKLAQRVILELKDKLGREMDGIVLGQGPAPGGPPGASGKVADAAAALAVLGYGSGEISAALRAVDTESLGLEEIIRQCLRQMLK